MDEKFVRETFSNSYDYYQLINMLITLDMFISVTLLILDAWFWKSLWLQIIIFVVFAFLMHFHERNLVRLDTIWILTSWDFLKLKVKDAEDNDHSIYLAMDDKILEALNDEELSQKINNKTKNLEVENLYNSKVIEGYKHENLNNFTPWVIVDKKSDSVYLNSNIPNDIMLFSTEQSAKSYIEHYLGAKPNYSVMQFSLSWDGK